MQQSYLIQRLQKPFRVAVAGAAFKDNPFAFGGGYRNGGLTTEAMDLLRDIFSFDYMGAAEFEYGAVPAAFRLLGEHKNLITFTLAVPFQYRSWTTREDVKGSGEVFVICDESQREEVSKRIKAWATGNGERTKELVMLDRALGSEEGSRTVGWLELDNGFMFFTDKEMFNKCAALFAPDTANTPTR